MGAKRLNTSVWSGSDLYNDADIPAKIDMSYGANYCDCSNIKASSVASMFGLSGALSLKNLCEIPYTFVTGGETGKVNAWSRYKSGYVTYDTMLPINCYDNPTFKFNYPIPYKLGDWAGYHHTEETKPTYWVSPFPSNLGNYLYGATYDLTSNGLVRGRLSPVLGDLENESLWSHVRIQTWFKPYGGTYSLIKTSDILDWSGEEVLHTIGDNGETPDSTYFLCFRPIYVDPMDDTTPIAVCEGGVCETQYTVCSFGSFINFDILTVEENTYTEHDGNITRVYWDFYITPNENTFVDIEINAIDNDAWWGPTLFSWLPAQTLTKGVATHYTGSHDFYGGLYDGTFTLYVSARPSGDPGIPFTNMGNIANDLPHWQSM